MEILWLEQTEVDVPTGNQWLSPRERICLSGMRFAKRRTDWRLGRWTAKQAVAACLNRSTDFPALAEVEVLAAPSGAPEVFLHNQPAGVAVSLSHRDGTAFCAVAPAGTNFGCDLETIEPRSNAFIADYCTREEQALIARTPVKRRTLLVSLIWSAKESALKALHEGLRLDTQCACVRPVDSFLHPDGKEWQELCFESLAYNPDGWRPLSVHYSGGGVYHGWWRSHNRFVRTLVSDLRLEIPARTRQQSGWLETLSST